MIKSARILGVGLLCGVFALLVGCEPQGYWSIQGQTMGTYYAIQANPIGRNGIDCAVQPANISAELHRINAAMSTYLPDSELSRFNQHTSAEAVAISHDLAKVMEVAQRVHNQTDGAFDVTIGPLVSLWGFGAGADRSGEAARQLPSASLQAQAAAKVGMDKLTFNDRALAKSRSDLYVDLSALAKGYAVDVLAELLAASHCQDFMVDIGGEIRTAGLSAKGAPWRIGIELPDPAQLGMLQTVMTLSDTSVATSGDYRNFRVLDGRRVDHVLDPRSGRPSENAVASVTVIHPSAMWADAYATAIMVLGLDAGLKLADRHGFAVYIIAKQPAGDGEDRFQSGYNSAMQQHLEVNAPASTNEPD